MRVTPSLLAGLALLAASFAASAKVQPADFAVIDARIYTANAKRDVAQALAVRDGHLVYVGNRAGLRPFIGPRTKIERFGGKLILPGLVDSHIHPTGIVDIDACDLKSEPMSLAQIASFVRGCIERFHVPDGAWINVRQWSPANGNAPDAEHPTLRAALDKASTRHPIELMGNDGHHGAFNSMALARATNSSGKVVGLSRETLETDFQSLRKLIGVDVGGEPNGTVNEDARAPLNRPSVRAQDRAELMKDPGRMTARLNSVGITAFMDASVPQESLPFYDALERSGKLSARAALALYFDPDTTLGPDGKPAWDKMVETAKATRAKYASDPLIRADIVKLFADGVLEGNPLSVPPTLPEVASIKPYLQPIFGTLPDGKRGVSGYVDTASELCEKVRAHRSQYSSAADASAFLGEHGFHPGQCEISSGQLQHERPVIMEYVRRFHEAGFGVHIHAIGDMPVRTAVDAIEAARAADGNSASHDALAHVQLVHPDDAVRIGRDHLYLAFTYSWIFSDPEYDLSVVPFFDRVHGGDHAALHPANGYYERNAYPVRALRDAGAILMGGSDAPVESRDPRPFMNMAMGVTRRFPGRADALNPSQRISVRDVIDAYTINGARYLNIDAAAGSIEVGKSADFIVVDRDLLALGDHDKADDIAGTKVLRTYFMGREVYRQK